MFRFKIWQGFQNVCHTNLERVLVALHESQILDFKVLPNIGVFGILFFSLLFFLLRMSSSCIHVTDCSFAMRLLIEMALPILYAHPDKVFETFQ